MDESKVLTDIGKLASSLARVAEETLNDEDSFKSTKQGVSLLQVRSATLMRYTNNLARYALSRVKASPDPDLINMLVEDYVTLGKLRPMSKALNHHFKHLLNDASKQTLSNPAEESHRPNPGAFLSADDTQAPEHVDQDDQYRPPRLTQTMDTEPDVPAKHQRQRSTDKAKRSSRNPDVAEAFAEIKGLPQVIRDDAIQDDHVADASEREHNRRRKYEESNLTRLPATKQERKRQQAAASGSAMAERHGSQLATLLDSVGAISKPKSDVRSRSGGKRSNGKRKSSRSRK